MTVEVKETRGRNPKYDFSGMKLGEHRDFENTTTDSVLNAAKKYANKNWLPWKFRTYTEKVDDINKVVLIRVE